MTTRAKICIASIVALALLAGFAAANWPSVVLGYAAFRVGSSTTRLPRCDRVEVCLLDGKTDGVAATGFPVRPEKAYSVILDRTTLVGDEAEALAALWRSQVFGLGFEGLCHHPAFGLRFRRGEAVVFETSVCFRCSNFSTTVLGEAGYWGFDHTRPQCTNLLLRLQGLFPGAAAKPKG